MNILKINNRIYWKELIIAVLIPIVVGMLSGLLTGDIKIVYEGFEKPFLAPPNWIFPMVWNLLYILMGIATYRLYANLKYVAKSSEEKKIIESGIRIYVFQLIFNLAWTPIFFKFKLYMIALIIAAILIVLTCLMLKKFYKADKIAGYLVMPLFIWYVFAAYLNGGIWMLNI